MLGTASPKPPRGSARRQKAKRQRLLAKLAKAVRAQCVERDGRCAIQRHHWDKLDVFGACSGPSEWAHIGRHRRCHTRGQAPEQRHTSGGSAILCRSHHAELDAHEFDIEPTTERGMDGPFRMVTR